MSSTDFTIDSLLDDLDDVATANDVDSRFSNSKFVPHPPNGEKSQSQVSIGSLPSNNPLPTTKDYSALSRSN